MYILGVRAVVEEQIAFPVLTKHCVILHSLRQVVNLIRYSACVCVCFFFLVFKNLRVGLFLCYLCFLLCSLVPNCSTFWFRVQRWARAEVCAKFGAWAQTIVIPLTSNVSFPD